MDVPAATSACSLQGTQGSAADKGAVWLPAGDVESADSCASCEYNAGKECISLSEVHGHDHSSDLERMSPLEKEPETARHVAMAQVGMLCSASSARQTSCARQHPGFSDGQCTVCTVFVSVVGCVTVSQLASMLQHCAWVSK